MKLIERIRNWISGVPRVLHERDAIRFTAAHRLPSSGWEYVTVIRIFAVLGALGILISHYSAGMVFDPETNILLEVASFVIVGLLNAFGRLAAVAELQSLDVPLESLRGWMIVLAWVSGLWLFRQSGLFDLTMWLINREHVTIVIRDGELTVRHGTFRFPRKIARDRIQDVLILANHPTGHDVMLLHKDGLTRLASIYGNQVRPTLFKLRLEQALAEIERPASTPSGQTLQNYN